MAKTKQQKEVSVTQLVDQLKTAKSVVFANFQGLKISETDELRKDCREQNIKFIASKKTLVNQALKQVGFDVDVTKFDGSVSVAFGVTDEVAPAQTLHKFATKHDAMKLFGGVLEGKYIDAAMVAQLAKLPSKQELLGKLVGTLNAPVSGFVNVLAGNLRGLVGVLNNIKESKA